VVDPSDQFAGRLFDLHEGRWTEIPASPVGGPGLSGDAITCAFVGDHRLVVWGRRGPPQGAVLDTTTMKWTPMAEAPVPPRYRCASASVGSKLLVWGGYGPLDPRRIGPLEDGALYDVETNTWEKLPAPPVPGHRYGVSAATWNGRFVLFGASGRRGDLQRIGLTFDPATRTWEAMAECPFDVGVHSATAVAGDRLFVWSGSSRGGGGGGDSPDAAAYDFRTRQWHKLPGAPIPPRKLASARAHGSRVTVWGGWTSDGDHDASLQDAATYDFETGNWEKIAPVPAGVPYELHAGW
jgi:N-acetylneuraminic acid mutarotase